MNTSPQLSVVMPVFDGEDYLEEAIQSVLDQTFQDFEFIIVNDGSKDSTSAIVRRFAEHDSRIRFEDLGHEGQAQSLNVGCRLARGQYIAIFDADDACLPNRFNCQMMFLREHPSIALLGAGVQKIRSDGKPFATVLFPTQEGEIRETLIKRSCFAHSTVVMLKQAISDVGGYRKAFFAAEDYDLWLRLAERYEVANLPSVLVKYRVHSNQLSSTQVERQVLSVLAAQIAARRRKEVGRESVVGHDQITPEFLAQNGVGRDVIEERTLGEYLSRAITLAECGAADLSLRTLEQAFAWARSARCSQPTFARIHASFAARHFRQRQMLKGFIALGKVCRGHPSEAVALLSRGWLKSWRHVAQIAKSFV
jgi:hypothetical protein